MPPCTSLYCLPKVNGEDPGGVTGHGAQQRVVGDVKQLYVSIIRALKGQVMVFIFNLNLPKPPSKPTYYATFI